MAVSVVGNRKSEFIFFSFFLISFHRICQTTEYLPIIYIAPYIIHGYNLSSLSLCYSLIRNYYVRTTLLIFVLLVCQYCLARTYFAPCALKYSDCLRTDCLVSSVLLQYLLLYPVVELEMVYVGDRITHLFKKYFSIPLLIIIC